jgi:hypothetical protein
MKHFRFLLQLTLATCFFAPLPAVADAFTDFFRAVNLDDDGMVRKLLERGFPVNAKDDKGQPAFVLAIRAPSPKVAERLFATPGFDLEQATPAGETPLMMAALSGQVDWTRRLLERGARHTSPSGWTALNYAASGEEPGTVRAVLARSPELDAAAPNGNTALMMAARFGDQRNVELLLAAGADASLRNRGGATAGDLARMAGRDRLAERLDQAAAAPPRR